MAMGRKSTKNKNLPPHMRARLQKSGKTYYYFDTGASPRVEIPLGCDYISALSKWAELEGRNQKPIFYFKDLADRYIKEVIPTKAQRTQTDNLIELQNLLNFFVDAPVNEIKPIHVRQYLDKRTNYGTASTTRANRERALISHIFNMARNWGVLDTVNPCQGIKGYTQTGRDIYIEDNVFNAVYNVASQPLKDAIDLAYLTGQRPADVISMSEADIQDGIILIKQGKTNVKIRMEITGDLKLLIDRIINAKKSYKVRTLQLICTETGRSISQQALAERFTKARAKAAKVAAENKTLAEEIMKYQFRDLRAKAITDKSESGGVNEAQKLAGHSTEKMTQHYVRSKIGEKVSPTR
jgi:integrase